MTPPALDHVVRTCLDKDPDRRWQSAGDVERQLKWIAEGGSQAGVSEPVARRQIRSRLAWGIAVGLIAGAIAAGITVWSLTRPADEPSMRFPVELTPREMLFWESGPVIALSPDGSRLAYVAGVPGKSWQIYIRSLDRLQATPLSGTEGARAPFFSPDGEWVAFFAGGELKKVSVFGGAPMTLCDAPNARGGSWGLKDIIIFAPFFSTGLFRVPAAGGTPEELTVLGEEENSHRWPYFLPDGEAVLFVSRKTDENFYDASIEVVSLATGERKVVHQGGTQPRYVPSGHIVFAHRGTLFAAPFDLGRLETTAPPVPIIEGVMSAGTAAGDGSAQYAFSKTGALVYLAGIAELELENYSLVWVDREGVPSPLLEQKGDYVTPRFSPDGLRLALGLGSEDIWIYEMEGGAMTRLTFAPGIDVPPVWSPDGERLAFSSSRGGGGGLNLFWKRADGTGEAERLTESNNAQFVQAWSPDGKVLVFCEVVRETGSDIWVLPLEGNREPLLFLQTPFNETFPRFSPDGRWLAYQSNESGRYEVYVQPYPGPGGKYQISADGGRHPLWGPEGRELFYRWGESMMVASYKVEGESFQPGRPRELFQGPFRLDENRFDADIAPDGKGFVMIQSATAEEGETKPNQVIVVTNWFEELKRLAPTKK
jgi:serine/threonine-protein kinase